MNRKLDLFQKLALATTATTYLLILVGGLVRATGAGMGCPDWPRCFGLWIPPTRASQLPPGYDPTLFDATLTWIEYLNRLLGVTVGFLIFATLVAAIRRHRRTPGVLWPSVLAFLGVGFEGWLGGRVVAHELAPWIVTAHLMGALVVVTLLLYATVNALFAGQRLPRVPPTRVWLLRATLVAGALALVQLVLGTQVRGTLEDVARANPGLPRDRWLDLVGLVDIGHKNLALMVVGACFVLVLRARSAHRDEPVLAWVALSALGLAAAQLGVGFGLAALALPPPLQVAHLVIACALLGALTVLGLLTSRLPLTSATAAKEGRASTVPPSGRSGRRAQGLSGDPQATCQ